VKRKKKKCRNPECGKEFTPYKSTDKFCCAHCFYSCQETKESKPKKSFKPISDKKAYRLSIYRPLRDTYLKEHPVCEVHDCERATTNLHHKKGREHNIFDDDWARDNDIPLLYDVRYFMACCDLCHPKRIHENPEWAYKHGYLISRI